MSPGAVRWAGILVFVGIALTVIFPFILVAAVGLQGLQAGTASLGGDAKILSTVVNIAMTGIMLFAFLATRTYFNALSYRRANIPIYIMVGFFIFWVVAGLFINNAGLTAMMQTGSAATAGVAVFILLIGVLINLVVFIVFASFCIGFGKVGGGLWKAIGILYLIGLIGIVAVIAFVGISIGLAAGGGLRSAASGGAVLSGVLMLVAVICYAAAVLCHGIGLVMGAGKMENMPTAADVFD